MLRIHFDPTCKEDLNRKYCISLKVPLTMMKTTTTTTTKEIIQQQTLYGDI